MMVLLPPIRAPRETPFPLNADIKGRAYHKNTAVRETKINKRDTSGLVSYTSGYRRMLLSEPALLISACRHRHAHSYAQNRATVAPNSLEVHAALLERHFVGRVAPVAEDRAPDARQVPWLVPWHKQRTQYSEGENSAETGGGAKRNAA